jgi:peptidoglycan/LPS O-acetylase OafA/YrhL
MDPELRWQMWTALVIVILIFIAVAWQMLAMTGTAGASWHNEDWLWTNAVVLFLGGILAAIFGFRTKGHGHSTRNHLLIALLFFSMGASLTVFGIGSALGVFDWDRWLPSALTGAPSCFFFALRHVRRAFSPDADKDDDA